MANRYWVGGTGTWDASSTANWSATSGGASGASAPTTSDNAFFDANSGTGACTVASGATCVSLTLSSANVSVTLSAAMTITGVVSHTLGMFDLNGNTFNASYFSSSGTGTRTVAFGSTGVMNLSVNNTAVWTSNTTGLTITGTPVINSTYSGSTGTRSFNVGALPEAQAITVNVTAGSDIIAHGTSAAFKNLNFTGFSGSFNNNNNATVYGDLTLSSNMSVTASAGTMTFAATSGTQKITTNNVAIDHPLTFNGVGCTFAFQDALTQGSTRAFTITNGTVQIKAGATSTVGAFATSGTGEKSLQSTSAGSQATLSQASGTVTAQYIQIRDINATGGAKWTASTGSINRGNNTGWSFILSVAKQVFNNIFRSVFRPVFNQ